MKTKFNGILTLFLAFIVQISFAQEKTISGTVSDETGPLPGVSVLKKGTKQGTETDFDGKYAIKAKTGDVLVFSFVGMKTVEKTVGASSKVDVILENDNVLEEIVVTGYKKESRTEITGSVTKVGSELLKSVVTPSVEQALQGNVSGLNVAAASGTPGAVANIRIRGISSINAGNDPLYVIDGVPIVNDNLGVNAAYSTMSPLSAINSDNIESITVLKDASSTAKYGARGANGVVIITTKDGKVGKTKFTIGTLWGVSNDAVEGPTFLTNSQRLDLASEAYSNVYPKKYPTKKEAEDYLLTKNSLFKAWNKDGRPESNWKDVLRNKNAVVSQINFSASGGGEKHTFYLGLGYNKQEGTVINTNFKRISGNVNFSRNLTEKLKFSTTNLASNSVQNGFLEGSAYFESPRAAMFFINPLRMPYDKNGTPAKIGGSLPNPLIITRDNINKNLFTRILSNNSLAWDIGYGLSAGTNLGIDYQVYHYRNFNNRNYGYSVSKSGEVLQSHRNNVTYTTQNYIDYNWVLNENHKITFKLLQEYQFNKRYYLEAEGMDIAGDELVNLDTTAKPVSVGSSFEDWYVAGYLAMAKYNSKNKYIIDLSVRREGNSRFGKDKRWGTFFAVGGAWNIHKESFLENNSVVSNLRLRASYGLAGNANIKLNQYNPLVYYDRAYAGKGATYLGTYGNEDLTWEKSKNIEFALEFGLLKNKISGSLGYFNRESYDLLLEVPLSRTTGFRTQFMNLGALTNSGLEADVKFKVVDNKDFKFTLGGNIGTLKNKVTELAKDPKGKERTVTTAISKIETGHPVREFYMRTWAGVNPKTGNDEWYLNGVSGKKTTEFNKAKRVYQGANAVPTLTAGLNLNIDYKGIFLSASGFYSGGNKIYEGWHRYLNSTSASAVLSYNGFNTLLDRWQKPGDVARNSKMRLGDNGWQRHSKYLYDGDFIRLRSVTLGYNLPEKAIKNTGFSGVKMYLTGTNLFTWVKDDNLVYDPEVLYDRITVGTSRGAQRSGETGLGAPPTKSISFGLTVNF